MGGFGVADEAGCGLDLVASTGGPPHEIREHPHHEHLERGEEDEQGVDGHPPIVVDDVVDELARTDEQQQEPDGEKHPEGIERQGHADDLEQVAPGVGPPVELRLAGPLGVLDGPVLHRVAVGQEGHGDGGDAAESRRQLAHVLEGHVAAESTHARVEVGNRRLHQVGGQLADRQLGRDPEDLVGALLGGASPDDLVVALHLSDQVRDEVVGIRHVHVGPDHDPTASCSGAELASRSRAPVGEELDESDALDLTQRLA